MMNVDAYVKMIKKIKTIDICMFNNFLFLNMQMLFELNDQFKI